MSNIVVAVTVTLALVLLYRHIEVSWPNSYFAPAESLARFASRGAGRYALFRFGPPFGLFMLVGAFAVESLPVTVGLYIAVSTMLSIWSALRDAEPERRLTRQRVAVLLVIAAGLVVVGVLARRVAPHISPYLPSFETVLVELIAAVIAATLTAAFIAGTRDGDVRRAGATIPDELGFAFRMIALDVGADDRLAASIALTEEAQRPYWFRRLELAFWRLNKGGSYGLYQVSGHGPVDDIMSCRIAMERLQGVYPLVGEYGWPVEWSVRAAAELHNPDRKFSEMVYVAYQMVDMPSVATSDGPAAADGRPIIDVRAAGRFGQAVRLRGTVWVSEGDSLVIEDLRPSLNGPVEIETVMLTGRDRCGWYADVPAGARRLAVRIVSREGSCYAEIAAKVDLAYVDVGRDLSLVPGR